MTAAARVLDLTKTYGSGDALVRALDNVTLDIAEREFTAVMGPSGSGKSTLMHCCAALDTADEGSVFLGDQDLTKLKDKALTRLRRDQIGFVFQSYNLVPTLTAQENIVLPVSRVLERVPRSTTCTSRPTAPRRPAGTATSSPIGKVAPISGSITAPPSANAHSGPDAAPN